MDPSNETTPPAQPSVAKETNLNGLVPQPPLFVEQPPMVVPSTTLLRKQTKLSAYLVSFFFFAALFAFAILVCYLASLGVRQTLGESAGIICRTGSWLGGLVPALVSLIVQKTTGIKVGSIILKHAPKKPVPQPVAVTPANTFLHDEEEPQYFRESKEEETARCKKQYVVFGLILFVAGMGFLYGFLFWLSGGDPDPKNLVGCLIGYLVGFGYWPVFILVLTKGKLSNIVWVYQGTVVAARANTQAGKEKLVELAPQPLAKPETNQDAEQGQV